MFHYRPPARPHHTRLFFLLLSPARKHRADDDDDSEKNNKKGDNERKSGRLNMEIHSRRRLFSQVGRSPLNIVCVALTGLKKKNSPCASWKAAGMREELSENDHENKNKQPGLNVSGCGSSEAFTTQKQQQTLTN